MESYKGIAIHVPSIQSSNFDVVSNLRLADNVVTATTDTAASNQREDDASKRESRPSTPPTLDTFQNLQLNGFDSRLGFDNETEVFYLEILQPETDNVIQRIPSESLVEYLNSQTQELLSSVSPPVSNNNLDQSI